MYLTCFYGLGEETILFVADIDNYTFLFPGTCRGNVGPGSIGEAGRGSLTRSVSVVHRRRWWSSTSCSTCAGGRERSFSSRMSGPIDFPCCNGLYQAIRRPRPPTGRPVSSIDGARRLGPSAAGDTRARAMRAVQVAPRRP